MSSSRRGPLVPDFRALVHSVTVHPKAAREGFQVEVKGKLAALIGGTAFPQAKYSGGRLVAEERYSAWGPSCRRLDVARILKRRQLHPRPACNPVDVRINLINLMALI
jgi:hypothetical protein